ncbi:MAG: PEP-CTERM sorting domain-containing protein [Fimbriimonadaceae bacterium]|nr:PEP-CTERM sorting domain-containing protein [Fimbriimonadaceae bacterium]
MQSKKLFVAAIGALFASIATQASAADTYINTGVNLVGNVDQRWKIGTSQTDFATSANTYFNGAYTAPFSGPSAWIGRDSASSTGTTWFTLDFNLDASFFTNNYGLQVEWASDNDSYLFLNDANTSDGFTGNIGYHPFGSAGSYSFQITKTVFLSAANGLVVGSNRIQFAVLNGGSAFGDNPTAVRAEFSAAPVPEPFTMVLGAAGIGLALRRRTKKA